ncbi:hypothetical protein SLE2022_352780 [Rubroshorea leprosula]
MDDQNLCSNLFKKLGAFLRKFLWKVLSVGHIPQHIAFILDGNRRYAQKHKLNKEDGYKAGYEALLYILNYCSELGVKYLTLYAFSLDNFKRKPGDVKCVMDLMLEKTQVLLKEKDLVHRYGVRLIFIGNLKLLSEPMRRAAENVMVATAANNRIVVLVSVAYTSTNEIARAVQKSCMEKFNTESHALKVPNMRPDTTIADVEKHMFLAAAPDPDILIRTSGEKRLSNFLLWQTSNCMLYSPAALWPEIRIWHLVWAIINYQRLHPYLDKKKNQP